MRAADRAGVFAAAIKTPPALTEHINPEPNQAIYAAMLTALRLVRIDLAFAVGVVAHHAPNANHGNTIVQIVAMIMTAIIVAQVSPS